MFLFNIFDNNNNNNNKFGILKTTLLPIRISLVILGIIFLLRINIKKIDLLQILVRILLLIIPKTVLRIIDILLILVLLIIEIILIKIFC